jgi:hypothetical protein
VRRMHTHAHKHPPSFAAAAGSSRAGAVLRTWGAWGWAGAGVSEPIRRRLQSKTGAPKPGKNTRPKICSQRGTAHTPLSTVPCCDEPQKIYCTRFSEPTAGQPIGKAGMEDCAPQGLHPPSPPRVAACSSHPSRLKRTQRVCGVSPHPRVGSLKCRLYNVPTPPDGTQCGV